MSKNSSSSPKIGSTKLAARNLRPVTCGPKFAARNLRPEICGPYVLCKGLIKKKVAHKEKIFFGTAKNLGQ
jgi:hypothetical protein